MLVKHIAQDNEKGTKPTHRTKVPEGSWAVIVKGLQTDLDNIALREEGTDQGAFLYTGSTDYHIIDGPSDFMSQYTRDLHELTLRRDYDGDSEICPGLPSYMYERTLLWMDKPFIAVVDHDDAIGTTWAHMATRVGEHGLTNQLPEFEQPTFVKSQATLLGLERPGKWSRFMDLCELTGLTPEQIMSHHARHVSDFMINVHFALAANEHEMRSLTQARQAYGMESFKDIDLSHVWVRKHFALVVLYCHHVGWHKKIAKATG